MCPILTDHNLNHNICKVSRSGRKVLQYVTAVQRGALRLYMEMSGMRCDTSWWKLSCLLLIPTTLERNTLTALTEWLGLTTKSHILNCSQSKNRLKMIRFPHWIYFGSTVFSQPVTCILFRQSAPVSEDFDILESLPRQIHAFKLSKSQLWHYSHIIKLWRFYS